MGEKKFNLGNLGVPRQGRHLSPSAISLLLQKKGKAAIAICCMFACVLVSGCGAKAEGDKWKDGYYTAMMEEYEFGWKEYVTICVMDSKIVSAEFNAKNASGFIKAWDNAYMKNMNPVSGTYPNQYTRYYASEFLANQDIDGVDMMAGATSSGVNFHKLAAAVLECAEKGDTEIAIVPVEQAE